MFCRLYQRRRCAPDHSWRIQGHVGPGVGKLGRGPGLRTPDLPQDFGAAWNLPGPVSEFDGCFPLSMNRRKTSNIQHPTSNIQCPLVGLFALDVGCWMFDVGCWMCSSGSGVQCANSWFRGILTPAFCLGEREDHRRCCDKPERPGMSRDGRGGTLSLRQRAGVRGTELALLPRDEDVWACIFHTQKRCVRARGTVSAFQAECEECRLGLASGPALERVRLATGSTSYRCGRVGEVAHPGN